MTPTEVEAIVSAFETFGDKDFSHRCLAHRPPAWSSYVIGRPSASNAATFDTEGVVLRVPAHLRAAASSA